MKFIKKEDGRVTTAIRVTHQLTVSDIEHGIAAYLNSCPEKINKNDCLKYIREDLEDDGFLAAMSTTHYKYLGEAKKLLKKWRIM